MNMTEYCRLSQNMHENAWIIYSDDAGVLNMPRYSYNNIIVIATNATVLEFLCAQSLHPDSLLPFYLFQHELEHKNNKS